MRQSGLILAFALAVIPVAAGAVPLLTLNENAGAEVLGSASFDAAGDGKNPVAVGIQIGGTSTNAIPGLALGAGDLGTYIEQADGSYMRFAVGTTCGNPIGDCVALTLNVANMVRVSSFVSDTFDPPDAANTETFSVGPAGAPVLNVAIVSPAECKPPKRFSPLSADDVLQCPIPEPAGLAILGVALSGLVWARTRRQPRLVP